MPRLARPALLVSLTGLAAALLTGCVPAADASTPKPETGTSPAAGSTQPAGDGFYMYCTPIDRTPGYYCTPADGQRPPSPIAPTPPPPMPTPSPPLTPTIEPPLPETTEPAPTPIEEPVADPATDAPPTQPSDGGAEGEEDATTIETPRSPSEPLETTA